MAPQTMNVGFKFRHRHRRNVRMFPHGLNLMRFEWGWKCSMMIGTLFHIFDQTCFFWVALPLTREFATPETNLGLHSSEVRTHQCNKHVSIIYCRYNWCLRPPKVIRLFSCATWWNFMWRVHPEWTFESDCSDFYVRVGVSCILSQTSSEALQQTLHLTCWHDIIFIDQVGMQNTGHDNSSFQLVTSRTFFCIFSSPQGSGLFLAPNWQYHQRFHKPNSDSKMGAVPVWCAVGAGRGGRSWSSWVII